MFGRFDAAHAQQRGGEIDEADQPVALATRLVVRRREVAELGRSFDMVAFAPIRCVTLQSTRHSTSTS
jgi:hypothetical protein